MIERPDKSFEDARSPTESARGPLSAPRVPRHEQEPGFLERKAAEGVVVQHVAENWDGDHKTLAPNTEWVVYPNGDIQRVSIRS